MTVKDEMNFDAICEYIENSNPNTKVLIGCDSKRFRKTINGKTEWYAKYARMIVVHNHDDAGIGKGAHLFSDIRVMRDYGKVIKSGKIVNLRQRLMQEVTFTLEVYDEIWEATGDREMQIHVDINSDESAPSNIALKEAAGYVYGVTGIRPTFKPDSPAATYAADARANGSLQ